jgi:hypothetical protein
MSRTPSHAHGAGPSPASPAKPATPVKAGPPATPAAPGAKAPASALLTKQNLIIGGAVAVVLALVITLWAWKPWQPSPPRLNSEPYVIAKYGASSAFNSLPFAQQREYMDILDETEKDLLEDYKAGKLSDTEYRRALQLGWYDKHLDRAENYAGMSSPAKRLAYLDRWAKPKKKGGEGDDEEEEEKPGRVGPRKAEDIKRDDSTEASDVRGWPADVRQRWMEYRSALATRKQYWKDQEAAAEAATGAALKPDADG